MGVFYCIGGPNNGEYVKDLGSSFRPKDSGFDSEIYRKSETNLGDQKVFYYIFYDVSDGQGFLVLLKKYCYI